MEVGDCLDQSFEYSIGLRVTKSAPGLVSNVVRQGNTRDVLHYKVDVVISFHDIEYLNNVPVLRMLEDCNFSSYGLLPLHILNSSLLINLDGYFFVEVSVESHSNRRIGTLTNLLPHNEPLLKLGRLIDVRLRLHSNHASLIQGRKQLVELVFNLKVFYRSY